MADFRFTNFYSQCHPSHIQSLMARERAMKNLLIDTQRKELPGILKNRSSFSGDNSPLDDFPYGFQKRQNYNTVNFKSASASDTSTCDEGGESATEQSTEKSTSVCDTSTVEDDNQEENETVSDDSEVIPPPVTTTCLSSTCESVDKNSKSKMSKSVTQSTTDNHSDTCSSNSTVKDKTPCTKNSQKEKIISALAKEIFKYKQQHQQNKKEDCMSKTSRQSGQSYLTNSTSINKSRIKPDDLLKRLLQKVGRILDEKLCDSCCLSEDEATQIERVLKCMKDKVLSEDDNELLLDIEQLLASYDTVEVSNFVPQVTNMVSDRPLYVSCVINGLRHIKANHLWSYLKTNEKEIDDLIADLTTVTNTNVTNTERTLILDLSKKLGNIYKATGSFPESDKIVSNVVPLREKTITNYVSNSSPCERETRSSISQFTANNNAEISQRSFDNRSLEMTKLLQDLKSVIKSHLLSARGNDILHDEIEDMLRCIKEYELKMLKDEFISIQDVELVKDLVRSYKAYIGGGDNYETRDTQLPEGSPDTLQVEDSYSSCNSKINNFKITLREDEMMSSRDSSVTSSTIYHNSPVIKPVNRRPKRVKSILSRNSSTRQTQSQNSHVTFIDNSSKCSSRKEQNVIPKPRASREATRRSTSRHSNSKIRKRSFSIGAMLFKKMFRISKKYENVQSLDLRQLAKFNGSSETNNESSSVSPVPSQGCWNDKRNVQAIVDKLYLLSDCCDDQGHQPRRYSRQDISERIHRSVSSMSRSRRKSSRSVSSKKFIPQGQQSRKIISSSARQTNKMRKQTSNEKLKCAHQVDIGQYLPESTNKHRVFLLPATHELLTSGGIGSTNGSSVVKNFLDILNCTFEAHYYQQKSGLSYFKCVVSGQKIDEVDQAMRYLNSRYKLELQ